MGRSITSANSVFTITCPAIFPIPFNVEGYAADAAFETEAVDSAEAVMGVDGKMAVGWTPFITPLNVTLQANSDSAQFFDDILGAQIAARESFQLDASIQLPSLKKVYTLTNGAMTRITQFPGAKKVLQPVSYQLKFESVLAAPLN